MFTGIIQAVGAVAGLDRRGSGARLRVRAPAGMLRRIRLGDSIAVNGCCLTVAARTARSFTADLAEETLSLTSLGELTTGAAVNLEPALRVGDPLGGHILQGHIEGVGRLLDCQPVEAEGGWWLRVRIPLPLRPFIVWKGSLALHGISLTVARWHGGVASFAIVPHTWRHTNLRTLVPGALVNLETDPLARHVANWLRHFQDR